MPVMVNREDLLQAKCIMVRVYPEVKVTSFELKLVL